MFKSDVKPRGSLSIKKIPGIVSAPLGWKFRNVMNLDYLRSLTGCKLATWFSDLTGVATIQTQLRIIVTPVDGGPRVDYGVVSRRLVTENFVDYLVDIFQADETMVGDFKYHAFGTGTTGATAADTAMETEISNGDAKITGGQGEQSGTTGNDYESSGTYTATGTVAVTEHGLFNGDTSAGDTLIMMDRHVFSAINLESGDGIEATYVLTVNSGG